MKTILVPLDGSQFSEHSLPIVISIARESGACLHLLNILAFSEMMWFGAESCGAGEFPEELRSRHQKYLENVSSRVGKQGVRVQTTLTSQRESISETIAEQAMKLKPDLVALTTHGWGGLARVFLGSVADQLIRQLSVPLLAIRPQEELVNLSSHPEIKQILVPLDGTVDAEKMVPSVAKLAEIMKAELTLLQVITVTKHPPKRVHPVDEEAADLGRMTEEAQSHLQEKAQSYLSSVSKTLRAQGLSVKTRLIHDQNPASVIINTAEQERFDVIALETHGRSGLSRLLLGSVADKVLRSSSVPLLVHRPLAE